jgi:hypothetical protein
MLKISKKNKMCQLILCARTHRHKHIRTRMYIMARDVNETDQVDRYRTIILILASRRQCTSARTCHAKQQRRYKSEERRLLGV